MGNPGILTLLANGRGNSVSQMARNMSRRDEIIDAARTILEDEGPGELTMRSIAARLGIRAPSLYKHIADKHELEVALITQGLLEQAETFTVAVAGATAPVDAIGSAYRAWALDHPHLYSLMNGKRLARAELPAGVEDAAAYPLLNAVGGDLNRARTLWAFAHGMVTLELADRFPADADLALAWETGLRQIARAP